MRIGIIQTRGLGDIIIAAPIANYYIDRGCEVYWPIDSEFMPAFSYAFPKINFIGIDKKVVGPNTAEFFYITPLEKLQKLECNSILCLYSHLTGFELGNSRLQNSLPFDAYKYAIAQVPFMEKWRLNVKRNIIREASLMEHLNINANDEYVVYQEEGSNFKVNLVPHIKEVGLRMIKIEPITENFLDWLGVIENSKSAYLVDSVYVNLVEQLNINLKKYLYLRSNVGFTPTTINQWTYI